MTRTAAMVIGFNTTMLLEAVAAGRPAVVLALGEAAGVMQNYVLDLRGAATVLEDEAQAADRILELVAEPRTVLAELPDSTRDVLERWTGNSDGRATDRTIAALRGRMHPTAARTTGADALG
jgi:chemotaxis regulatin CheY-phosphate phosphatase CheZ